MGEVKILKEDLWPLLLSTMRYAIGRRSYMPSYIQKMIQHYSGDLLPEQLKQMCEEVEEGMEIEEVNPGYMGEGVDVAGWNCFIGWCRMAYHKRLLALSLEGVTAVSTPEVLPEEYTCYGCAESATCKSAWDGYNTGGDCLESK